MNINGTYKVNVELSVRKMVEIVDTEIESIIAKYLGAGASAIPRDPNKESKVQQMISQYQRDELATTMRLEIGPERASIRSTDGDGDYRIKNRKVSEDGRFSLVIEILDAGEDIQWDGSIIGDRFLVFSGDTDMGGFVWERA